MSKPVLVISGMCVAAAMAFTGKVLSSDAPEPVQNLTNMVDSPEPCTFTNEGVTLKNAYVKAMNPSRVYAVGCGMNRDFKIKRLTLDRSLRTGTYAELKLTVAQ